MSSRRTPALGSMALGLVALLVVGCGPSGTAEDASTSTSGDVAAGEVLYQANCAACHGADLRGTDQGPPHLDPIYLPDHHADLSFRLAIEQGVQPHHWPFGPMPPVEGLDQQDITDVIAYVRDQQREAGLLR